MLRRPDGHRWREIHDRINGDESIAPAARPSLAASFYAVKLGFRSCFYASHEGCGCSGTTCFRHGRIVQLTDCIECLKGK